MKNTTSDLAPSGKSDAVYYIDHLGNRYSPADPLQEHQEREARSNEIIERYKQAAFGPFYRSPETLRKLKSHLRRTAFSPFGKEVA